MFLQAMFGLGVPELLIILAVVLLLFGGSRLAGLGKSTGRALKEFKEETKGIKGEEKGEQAGVTSAETPAPPQAGSYQQPPASQQSQSYQQSQNYQEPQSHQQPQNYQQPPTHQQPVFDQPPSHQQPTHQQPIYEQPPSQNPDGSEIRKDV